MARLEDEGPPPSDTGRSRDQYEVGRLLAFSDGVFAIAITLLVLSIPVPDLPDPSNAALREALVRLLPNLFAFLLSFAIVGRYWSIHRQLLGALVRADRRVVGLNLGILLTICLVPFSSGLLTRYGNVPIAVQVYAANVALIGIVFGGLRFYLSGRRELADQATLKEQSNTERTLLAPAIFLVSIPIAFWSPLAAELSWLSLILAGRISTLVRGRRAREPGKQDS